MQVSTKEHDEAKQNSMPYEQQQPLTTQTMKQ